MLVDLALHRYVRLCFFRAITVSLGARPLTLLLPRSQKRPKLSYVAIVPMIPFGCSRSVSVTGSGGPFGRSVRFQTGGKCLGSLVSD